MIKENGSLGKPCPRKSSLLKQEENSTQAGITVKYWNFLQETDIQCINTVYSSVFQLPLEMSGHQSISRSKATPTVNAFALELHFTIDAKTPSAKDAKLN